MEWICGVERACATQRFNYVIAKGTVRLSSKHERCKQSEPPARLVEAVGVRDLPCREAERRLDLPDATDPRHEAEPTSRQARSPPTAGSTWRSRRSVCRCLARSQRCLSAA